MRSILVHWLIEVIDECKMRRQTLFLAVGYLDRFLQLYNKPIPTCMIQLIGVSCLLVATYNFIFFYFCHTFLRKVEEVQIPLIDELIFFTDDGYSATQIVFTESLILTGLDFDLIMSTINTFLLRFLEVGKASSTVMHYAQVFTFLILNSL
jgi:cyclin A